jgi:hypothetical protein
MRIAVSVKLVLVAGFGFSAAAARTPPPPLGAEPIIVWRADVPRETDDSLIVSGGIVNLITNGKGLPTTDRALRLETDACGTFKRAHSGNSIVKQSAFDEREDGPDGDDPWDEFETQLSRWLAAHTEIMVTSNGVLDACDDDLFDSMSNELNAGAPSPIGPPLPRPAPWPTYIT